ncbi:hypothetical protein I79_017165 [Cricetulus griseus]|uniref:Uncharacterized protein n=1 Tax=Cricetulus griseus TaxID=10029 RepID=G3I1B2_CRIGR|nr:hypothetical protein I79_017165 [Cricetulus griseus]
MSTARLNLTKTLGAIHETGKPWGQSASQKGNLKTHVLCVHRMPFDNSQYPDRRFKRSRVDSEASGNFEEAATVKAGSFAELTDERSKGQEEGH